jgi:hypothetical protein
MVRLDWRALRHVKVTKPNCSTIIAYDRRCSMDEEIKDKILALLDQRRKMTIATLRPDGWPQTTTVGYANEGPRGPRDFTADALSDPEKSRT